MQFASYVAPLPTSTSLLQFIAILRGSVQFTDYIALLPTSTSVLHTVHRMQFTDYMYIVPVPTCTSTSLLQLIMILILCLMPSVNVRKLIFAFERNCTI